MDLQRSVGLGLAVPLAAWALAGCSIGETPSLTTFDIPTTGMPPDGTTEDPGNTGTMPTDGGSTVADSTGGDSTDGPPPGDTTSAPPASCGNGTVEDGEDCDDGGESATCNDDCTAAACGDGIVNAAAGEACDEAGETATCNDDCTAAACGDGVLNVTAGEDCDDGGESMACDSDCTAAMCGDGLANAAAGEECDDSGESASCDADCTAATCGDGVLNAMAGEICDDGGMGSCTLTCLPCNVFEEDFSDNLAGWTLGVEWEIGSATVSAGHTVSCGNADPGTDHSPTGDNGVAGVVIGGNAAPVVHGYYYLTSPVIAVGPGYTSLDLDFWRWLNSDYTRYMQNQVQVYDGATWQTVWQSGPSPGIQDAAWTNVVYDITAYANPNLQVRIGFQIGSTGVFTCSGWNVDDLLIVSGDC